MTGRTRDLPVFPLSADPIREGVPPTVQAVSGRFVAVGPEGGPRIGLVTLGCDKNTVDSERMMAALVGHGARVTADVEGADVIVINTCGFIQAAKEQSVETMLEACQLKEQGQVQAVVAVGCMVQRYKSELVEELPEVDLFLGLTELEKLVPALRERDLLPAPEDVPIMERPLRVLSTATAHTSFLKISEGCDHTCAFCAIPLMRGLHRSHPVEDLVAEARALAEQGVRELNIVSQDTTWYGRDLKRHEGPGAPLLQDLLRALLAGTDLPWHRLFYMYPSGITRELVDLMADESRILPYLDVPLQHGSDRILMAMRRPERRDTIRERIGWLREAIADLTLRTTVIVGFPGEADEDFDQLLGLLEEIRFDRVGAFMYSDEDGTRAADLPARVPQSLKRERMERLLDVQRGISLEKNIDQIGRVVDAIIDQPATDDPDFGWVARTVGQALDVDGVTWLVDEPDRPQPQPGHIVAVEIVDGHEYDLVARLVD